MARTARSLHARKKRRKILKQAKGYRGTKSTSYKRAKEQVWKSGVYAYEGRKQRKRDFRSLWIQRINAGAREHGLSYSQLIHGLRLAEIDLDRKVLADLAATEPVAFAAVVAQAQNALNGDPVQRRIEVERKPEPQARQKPEPREPEPAAEPAEEPEASAEESTPEVEATEAAERKTGELDVDLESVEGTGAEGRITVGDVEEAAGEEGAVNATEAAERKAEELGVDLSTVEGTGANGRITVGDVEKAAGSGS
ncbi:MAG: 50S ribosomal protein L20 [Rubrobacter sp.]|nr:50S ribosomal protein L20 [Rubrobacter sp.]